MAIAEGGAQGVVVGVAEVVGLAIEVGGGADVLIGGSREGVFPGRERAAGGAAGHEESEEESATACGGCTTICWGISHEFYLHVVFRWNC